MFKKQSIQTGFSFGFTSGIITTLGLIIGLNSGTHSRIVILSGILTIAVADALSDALGIHISEESRHKQLPREIWESTFSTFFSKLIIAFTFVIPVLLFSLHLAIGISIIWGLFLIGIFSFYLAKKQGNKPHKVILEHIVIAIAVIILTNYTGMVASRIGINVK